MYEDEKVVIKAGEDVYKGVVVAFDRDIGCTIVEEDDKDHYLVCLHGPLSKEILNGSRCYTEGLNVMLFDYLEGCICDEVTITREKIDELISVFYNDVTTRIPSSDRCAFNQ